MATNNVTKSAGRDMIPEVGVTISQEDAIVFGKLLPAGGGSSKFDNVAGMIAYAQYALHEHQFIEQYGKEEGKPPTEDHLKSIILTFKDENGAALESLKEQSKKLLREYAVEYADSIEHKHILEPIRSEIQARTRFWLSVSASIFEALIYSFLVALVISIATAAMPETRFS